MKFANGEPKAELLKPDEARIPKSEVTPRGNSAFGIRISDLTLWQLADSAFPTGGFAHSAGLEAAWQHGEVRNRIELISFLEASLHQLGHAALPFVSAAFDDPGRVNELDEWCDAFTTNHVANRASRTQGRALLLAAERIFQSAIRNPKSAIASPSCSHLAPVFGAVMAGLKVPRDTTQHLFLFNHLRGVIAAAVRLNIVGPMDAQAIQHQLAPATEAILNQCQSLTPDDVAQTAPLLELWQGAQDRLYSRLFQS